MPPTTDDAFPTETSFMQAKLERVLSAHRVPRQSLVLHKNEHLQFLVRNLVQGFPERYTSQDASQPWLLFWTIQGFSVLQVGLDPGNRQRAVDTVLSWQHPSGGFGGGPGQFSHLLPTYAAVCSLAIAGKPGPGGGWDQIDRQKMYEFFMSLKQPDGSFLVSHHGEVDVRGIYCLIVVAILLDIITPELVQGTSEFLTSCQTYEGGFASSSHPYYVPTAESTGPSVLQSPRPPLGEAHGGYTFCALAAWVMLEPFRTPTSVSINEKALVRWLVQMQGSEVELGGFKGRTNKLVDGCYSWWVGGAFALLEAVKGVRKPRSGADKGAALNDTTDWQDVDDALLNREALQEYVLAAGQYPAGGLRDKPPKSADSYHTLYCLSGLSSSQHPMAQSPTRRADILAAWQPRQGDEHDNVRKTVFASSLAWMEEEGATNIVGDSANNRVNASHPLFNLTVTHTEAVMSHFYGQALPPKTFKTAAPQ